MALRLRGATSGYIELKAPASAGDNTLTLPTNNGGANQLLKIDGSGNLSWQSNLTFDGSTLTVTGGIGISTGLFHIGDDDTKIDFTDNQIDLRTGSISRIYINNYALYVRTGFPFAFLATSGDSPNIKSGGTNAQDLLLTTGSGNPTRLQIGVGGDVTVNTGNLVIGTSGKGINFSPYADGTGNPSSNCLADYEEGTWTPECKIETRAASDSPIDGVDGCYTKVGRVVTCHGKFVLNGTPTERSTGRAIEIHGFPFDHNHDWDKVSGDVRVSGHLLTSTYGDDISFVLRMIPGSQYCRLELLEHSYNGVRNASVIMQDDMYVVFSFTYVTV